MGGGGGGGGGGGEWVCSGLGFGLEHNNEWAGWEEVGGLGVAPWVQCRCRQPPCPPAIAVTGNCGWSGGIIGCMEGGAQVG